MKPFLLTVLRILLVPAVFFAAMLVAMQWTIHGEEVKMPALTGLPQTEALDLATRQGLLLHIENRFYDRAMPAGDVLTQSPAAGTTVRKGLRVNVTVSLGPGA